jgi:glycosyltransferase involved in cell wall biosynthesis
VNNTPLVTIAIPTYNGERFIRNTLRSVFVQTYQNWELLLTDDCSTDRSFEILQAIDDPRVRVLHNEQNRGLIWTLNRQIELARGELFARMDHDDLMHPDRLTREVALHQEKPGLDVVGSAIYVINGSNQLTGIRAETFRPDPPSVLRGVLLFHPTILARREWLLANPYNNHYVRSEDHELWCRTIHTVKAAHIADPLLFYRETIPINLKAYLQTARSEYRILLRFGPSFVGRGTTLKLLLSRFMKAQVYRVFTRLGWHERLLAARSRRLTDAEHDAGSRVLQQILSTNVPGLD